MARKGDLSFDFMSVGAGNFRYRGVADTPERKEKVGSAYFAQEPGEKNAKVDMAIHFRLRLSFVLRISECCLFLFMTVAQLAITQVALTGRGIITS
ncbi:hypothetical protein [Janthinobacterium sp. 61]|uniref:hypothetical protein n=1 Tax=Janthinobacterium sp. 61 TaxID=2035209 RepID=UPI00117ADF8F|nr:hypothetical protein [Janthinobacterium sp. 61]